jgi:hypothetical protein
MNGITAMMPPLNKDWLEFIESFNGNRVEYLIVGAFAVAHHGRPRLTGDLDLRVKQSPGWKTGPGFCPRCGNLVSSR